MPLASGVAFVVGATLIALFAALHMGLLGNGRRAGTRIAVMILGIAALTFGLGRLAMEHVMVAAVPQIYDGAVDEPSISRWQDPSTGETIVTASSENWSDGDANLRLEATLTLTTGAGAMAKALQVQVVRVGADEAWSARTALGLVADGQALKLGPATMSSRGVKIGVEETVSASIAPYDLVRCAQATHCEVHVDDAKFMLSGPTQARFSEFIAEQRVAGP